MGNELLLRISIFFIVIFSFVIIQGLTILYTNKREWRFLSLMLIPFAFGMTYLWIGLYEPSSESVRSTVRAVILFSSCDATHVIYTYIARLAREKKKRELSHANTST